MIDISKLAGIFDPLKCPTITIVGVGAVGSSLAELVARLGVQKLVIYDADKVEMHNVVNSSLNTVDVGRYKVNCVEEMVKKINPDIEVVKHGFWKPGMNTPGIVFLAVDSIDTRNQFVDANIGNETIKAVFDIRTGLYTAQGYAADWSKMDDVQKLKKSMDFKHEDVKEERSACGAVLGLAPVVRIITSLQIYNMIRFLNDGPIKTWINFDLSYFEIDCF